MKSPTFYKNSWHYLIAHKIAGYSPYDDAGKNICTYTKYVIGGIIALSVIGAGIAAAGFLFFNLIFGIIFSLIYGAWIMTPIAEATLIMGTIIGTFLALLKLFKMRRERLMSTENRNRQDGFVKHAYKSWKEKFCLRIEFTE
jgi:hypothetical protein